MTEEPTTRTAESEAQPSGGECACCRPSESAEAEASPDVAALQARRAAIEQRLATLAGRVAGNRQS